MKRPPAPLTNPPELSEEFADHLTLWAHTVSLAGTGTKWGWSYWERWLGCPKAAVLDESQPERVGLSGNLDMDVGTAVHALLANYYRREQERRKAGVDWPEELNTDAIVWVDAGKVPQTYEEQVQAEAVRVFRAYRLLSPSWQLGTPQQIEQAVEWERPWGGRMPAATIRPDLVVRLSAGQLAQSDVQSPIRLPGYYLVDHKVRGRERPEQATLDREDLRYTFYNEVYAARMGGKTFRGTIVNTIYRGKEIRYHRSLIPHPAPIGMRERLLGTLGYASAIRAASLDDSVPLEDLAIHPDCYTWRGPCRHYPRNCPGH